MEENAPKEERNIKIGITRKLFYVFVTPIIFSLIIGFLLHYPLFYIIEFSARGFHGDETILVKKNWGYSTIRSTTVLGKEWQSFRLTSWYPIFNLQLYCLNLSSESPPRQTTILAGTVKVSRRNLLGYLVDKTDWLNIDAQYLSLEGQPFFDVSNPAMATARSGITGWTGYYHLIYHKT
ncbi:hypothetical protein CCP2SC5_440035 [Azospirillaceae bacterium]